MLTGEREKITLGVKMERVDVRISVRIVLQLSEPNNDEHLF